MEAKKESGISKIKEIDQSQNLCPKINSHKKSKKKDRKRKHSSSSEDSIQKTSKKLKSKHKKCKKRHKHNKDKRSKEKHLNKTEENENTEETDLIGPDIPDQLLQKAKSMAPMSKEEWEKKQNTIRRVFDEETGRTRLVRGEGEIVEEIVSRERHQEINRQATIGDGNFFQSKVKKSI